MECRFRAPLGAGHNPRKVTTTEIILLRPSLVERGFLSGESALASNRFGPTSRAIRFVDELYRAGAVRVVVPEEAIDDGIEVYADSLVVIMPSDPEKRRRVRALCDREIRREGFDPREDGDADQVYLWWD